MAFVVFNKIMKWKVGGQWAKNINAMEWTKQEEFENLTKIAEHEQQTSLNVSENTFSFSFLCYRCWET